MFVFEQKYVYYVYRCPQRPEGALELEFEVLLSCLTSGLGTEPMFSVRRASTLNC